MSCWEGSLRACRRIAVLSLLCGSGPVWDGDPCHTEAEGTEGGLGCGRGASGQDVLVPPSQGFSLSACMYVMMRAEGVMEVGTLSSAPSDRAHGARNRVSHSEPWFSRLLPMCGPRACAKSIVRWSTP